MIPWGQDFCHSPRQASKGPSWEDEGTGWQEGRPNSPQAVVNEEGKQGVAVPLQPSQVASEFCKEGEGSRRLRTGAREAGAEGAHGGATMTAGPPVESKIEKPCVSSQAPGQPGSRLHSVPHNSSWHQLQLGTMPGFLSFFF